MAMTQRAFGLPSGDAAGLHDEYQWPHNESLNARPAVEITPQMRYGDLDDWLRQADIDFDRHQVQGEENQTTVVQAQPSAVPELVDYEARALA